MTGGKRRQDFNLMCESFGLPHKKFNLDVPHRWNSLYLMLKSCLPYKDPLICYYNRNISDNIRLLDETDFTMVKYFIEFLKPFYNATHALSGVYYSTSCMALQQLYEISSTFEKFGNYPVFNEIVIKMKEIFLKYWNNIPLLYTLTACLDPRIKLVGVQTLIESIGGALKIPLDMNIRKVEENLNDMFDNYAIKYGEEDQNQTLTESQGKYSSSSSFFSGSYNLLRVGTQPSSSSNIYSRQELNTFNSTRYDYMFQTYKEWEQFDVIDFWKSNSLAYPILALMARDLLTIPVSSVACEQVFSISGNILDERRNRLNGDILEALMCVKDWELARHRTQNVSEEHEDCIEHLG
jgi:hypothetical protein